MSVADGHLLVDPRSAPGSLQPLLAAVPGLDARALSRLPVDPGARAGAVLVLLADGEPDGPDVLLTRRADGLRHHPGQPAFPGGAQDPGDDGPVGTALREAAEEVGLEPATVRPLALLPGLWVPPSGFVVVPVLAHWEAPHRVAAVDRAEVSEVLRVPLAVLADPARRLTVRHPSGWAGPGFELPGLLVWGFTAGLLDRLLELGGFARPWDASRTRDSPVPPGAAAATLPREVASGGSSAGGAAGGLPGEGPP